VLCLFAGAAFLRAQDAATPPSLPLPLPPAPLGVP
jgi:hypothetical protein